MKRCVIIAAGDKGNLGPKDIGLLPEDLVYCCDAGYAYAQEWGIKPHLVVGDFDSYQEELPADLPIHRSPVEKDDTDTLLAIRLGLEQGCDSFLLVAVTGGRLDHTIANIQTMAWLVQQGKECVLLGAHERLTMVQNGSVHLPRREGTLSVFCYGPTATGVTLEGVYYPLTQAVLNNTFPIGVSNQVVDPQAKITVEEGCLLLLQCDADGFAPATN